MAAITLDIGGNTRQLDRDIQKTVNRVYSINLKTKGDQPLGRITGKVNEFTKSLDASNARVIAFGASAGIIFGLERAFTALVSSTIEVQKSLQDINVILNVSTEQLNKFGGQLFNIARNTGQGFQEVAKAATEFSRQGLGVEETLKRTNEALILSRLSGLDAAKSVEALTAAVNSFASQSVTATEIVNKFATVDAAFAVSSADLADAISRVGSSAAQSGVSLNELIAIVTSAQQTTARGGAVIGNSFKTIFTRLQREKVVDLLESLGISGTNASGQVKSTIQLLQELGAVYDTLGSQQQAYVAEQVGGVFQINILKAALADLGKEYSIYGSALNVAAGATDQAIRRNEELNKTYAAQINALQENARQLAAAAGERLLGPSIDRLVGGTNTLLQGFSESDGQGVGSILGKGILDGIGQFISGPGLALIGGVLLKLFRDLAKFATGSVQQLLGLNTAATQQRDLQQSINQILAKNPQLLQLALQGEQGLNTAANSLLASLQKQTVELQKQASVAQQIAQAFVAQAGVRVAGGVPVVPKGKAGKAYGYIPNFVKDDFAREELLATALGARNPTAQLSKGTIDGQKFIKNNREIEITNFGRNGDSAVIPNYAKGFIPNFQKAAQTPKEIVVTGAKKYGYLIPSTAPGRLSTPDKPIPGGTVTDTANNTKYVFPPQTAYGPKLIGEAESSNKLENQIYQSVLNRTASYTRKLAPPGKPVSPSDLEKGFQSAKGARGAILSAIGAAFEVGITTALGYEAAKSNSGAGDFDVRAGKGIEKIQNLFGIGGIQKADFKATTGGDSVTSFRKKILREEFGFGGAKKRTGPTGKELRERGLTSGFKRKAFAGYIPNFAAIQDAVERERAAGIPSSQIYLAQEKALTSANPMGLGVFNKQDEPTKSSRKDAMRRKGFARGYIPNFAIEDPDQQAAGLGTSVAAVVAQLGFLAFSLQGSRQQYKQSLKELTDSNVRAAKNNLRVAREAGASKQVRRQLSQNVRTAQAGTAGQKFAAGTGAGGFALSIGAPIIAETIKNAIGEQTATTRRTGAAVGAAGQVAAFTGAGAMFGPWGAAIGAATGALLTIPDLIDQMTTTVPEFSKRTASAAQSLTKFGESSQRLLTSYETLAKSIKDGGPKVLKAQAEFAKVLNEFSPKEREAIGEVVRQGKSPTEKIAELTDKKQGEVITTAAEEEISRIGSTVRKSAALDILDNPVTASIPYLSGLSQIVGAGRATGLIEPTQALTTGRREKDVLSRENLGQQFVTTIRGNQDVLKFVQSVAKIKFPQSEVKNLEDFNKFIDQFQFSKDFKKELLDIAKADPGLIFKIIKSQIALSSKEAQKSLTITVNGTKVEQDREQALEKARQSIENTIGSVQKNIAVQNLLSSTLDNTAESFRSLAADLKTSAITQQADTLESIIGTTAAPAMALRAQSDTAIIQKEQNAGIAAAGIDFKNEIRNILGKPFQENLNKIIEKLRAEGGALEGKPKEIIAQSDVIRTQANTEQQKLTQAMQRTEGLMRDFVNGQVTNEQLLDGVRMELSKVGIKTERGTEASNEIEMAVANYGAKSINEYVKAFQQRAKLANETKQAILQAQIEQATKVFGGFEGFMNRPEEEQNYIEKIDKDLKNIEKIRASTPFRYNNRASVQEQERQAPELGRNFANVYTELLSQSGGAFRDFLQTEADTIRGVSGSESRANRAGAGAIGGFQDVIRGREEDIKSQLKLAEDQLKVTTDPVLKRTLEGFINSIKNIPGGTKGIAEIQTMKEFGVANQKDYEKTYGKFENQSLQRLKEISPELAASLESALSVSDDPLMAEAQLQSGLQGEIVGFLGPIQGALLQMAKSGMGSGGSIEAYVPKLNAEQQKRAEEFKAENAKIEARAKEIQNSTTPQPKKSVSEIEAETVRARDQKRFETWSQAGGMGLGPIADKDAFGASQYSPDTFKSFSKDLISPELMSTFFGKTYGGDFSPTVGKSYAESNDWATRYIAPSRKDEIFKDYPDKPENYNTQLDDWAKASLNTPFSKVTYGKAMQGVEYSRTNDAINNQSFTQQEAALNNNTSSINTLVSAVENFNANVNNLTTNLNNQPNPQAGAQTQPGTQPNVTTTTNAPVTVVVNAEGGGDIATAVAAAIQNAIPDIVNQVRLARREKVPPTPPKGTLQKATSQGS